MNTIKLARAALRVTAAKLRAAQVEHAAARDVFEDLEAWAKVRTAASVSRRKRDRHVRQCRKCSERMLCKSGKALHSDYLRRIRPVHAQRNRRYEEGCL